MENFNLRCSSCSNNTETPPKGGRSLLIRYNCREVSVNSLLGHTHQYSRVGVDYVGGIGVVGVAYRLVVLEPGVSGGRDALLVPTAQLHR